MQKKIGFVKIPNFTVLAPISGITNLPFRLSIKKTGCGLVYSEMVSSNALLKKTPKSIDMLRSTKIEKPLTIQLVGSNPQIIVRAAQKAEQLNADIIDINCGCSVKKILKNGSGAALMKNTKKLEKILTSIKKSINIPLTIKIRSGWCPSGEDAIKVSILAERCGVDAIAIHPRTVTQGFKGIADWNIIKKLKKKVKIPIIGNGDIKTAEDAFIMKRITNCDFVMIGRASIKNPLIFEQINIIKKLYKEMKKNSKEKFVILERYLKNSEYYFGEKTTLPELKNQSLSFLKKTRNASYLLFCNNFINSKDELYFLLSKYRRFSKNLI